jgi:hypothetical protein
MAVNLVSTDRDLDEFYRKTQWVHVVHGDARYAMHVTSAPGGLPDLKHRGSQTLDANPLNENRGQNA